MMLVQMAHIAGWRRERLYPPMFHRTQTGLSAAVFNQYINATLGLRAHEVLCYHGRPLLEPRILRPA